MLFKLAVEARVLRPLDEDDDTPTAALKSAQMLTGPLHRAHALRIATALFIVPPLALLVATGKLPSPIAWIVLAVSLASELTERYLYFRAVVAPKMPGVVSK
jgi:hypothetical protein